MPGKQVWRGIRYLIEAIKLNRSMSKTSSLFGIVAFTLLLASCASVPDVESRLQSLQLHSNMYVVQAGETVESIAHRYQLTPAELESLNPGLQSSITAGLRINVRPGTSLSNDVRARAAYAPAIQPRIIDRRQATAVTPVPSTMASSEVQVNPTRANPEIVHRQPVETIIEDDLGPVASAQMPQAIDNRVIKEIPATSWSSERVVVENGQFTEEVIPDDLDYTPVADSRAAMQGELQQYVGEWSWPTEGQIAREFAPQEVGGQGVDIAGVPGQDIRAAMAGTVVYSGRDLSGGGNLIIVRHSDSLMTTYSHADQLFVAEDDHVVAGDPIASLGWNANRESVLRFEVREDGNPLDPMKFLPLR